ncbi:MAG: hypothetical protein ACM34N_11490 [Ignavibacteria bacterium]
MNGVNENHRRAGQAGRSEMKASLILIELLTKYTHFIFYLAEATRRLASIKY